MDWTERTEVWHRVEADLNRRMPDWKERIGSMEQLPAIGKREAGQTWTDCEVFEALVLSVLTNSVDWSRIQSIRHELKDCFGEFDPVTFANLETHEVQDRLIPWFKERKAGALTHRQSFTLLIESAAQLIVRAKEHGTIDAYIGNLYEDCGRQPIELAILLGAKKSLHKLRGIGIPLAAEFSKNLGYDAAKPDRHICRALGAIGWVEFKCWPDHSESRAPWPSENEMVDVMRTMESWATGVDQHTAFVDNALWLLCARSGLRLSNEELSRLGQTSREEPNPHETQNAIRDGRHIARERVDRFTWGPADVIPVSNEEFEAALDAMYGKGNRPGVNGFRG